MTEFLVQGGVQRSDAALDFLGASLNARIAPVASAQGPSMTVNPGTPDGGTDLATRSEIKTEKPKMYKVLILNDDLTPLLFVVDLLQRFFNKSFSEAYKITRQAHEEGVGVAGVYTYDIAETKISETMDYVRNNRHPLQLTMEPE